MGRVSSVEEGDRLHRLRALEAPSGRFVRASVGSVRAHLVGWSVDCARFGKAVA